MYSYHSGGWLWWVVLLPMMLAGPVIWGLCPGDDLSTCLVHWWGFLEAWTEWDAVMAGSLPHSW